MRIEDIVEGGVYRGGTDKRPIVRKVLKIYDSMLYTQEGVNGDGVRECFYIAWFARWAEERIA